MLVVPASDKWLNVTMSRQPRTALLLRASRLVPVPFLCLFISVGEIFHFLDALLNSLAGFHACVDVLRDFPPCRLCFSTFW